MTVASSPSSSAGPTRAHPPARFAAMAGLGNAVHAELRKLGTLPSLRWAAGLTWAATVVLALAAHRAAPGTDPIRTALRWTQAGFLVFGVLAATHEYESGGQIRATLLAVPRRFGLAAAKAIALVAVVAVLAAPAGTPYLVSVALAGAGLGGILRNAVAAVAAGLILYLILCPVMLGRFPSSAAWLPDTALLELGRGAAAAVLWPVALLVAAAVSLRRRNA
ncbi:hypothetical protein [Paractinoplanes hotanensis]|uniref:ABC transporter permease n=1 Tax=Paractinoplanes hotanensis TaxID=2906497 RepID=A0ABT0YFP3_9ACTN|nr:hypothetical protein [Actinoplanes hotanensis]MCM4084530.1 hypothetical protein [Actinoplanes hotanensis]